MSPELDTVPLGRRARIDRMRARSWALQMLYAWEAQGARGVPSDVVPSVLETRSVSAARVPRIAEHLNAVGENLDRIDAIIGDAAENWRLERLSRVDRCILRLAVAEMLFIPDVPPKVSIQEAIRLAGQYGGDESPRFVNGVLDAVYRTHARTPADEADDAAPS